MASASLSSAGLNPRARAAARTSSPWGSTPPRARIARLKERFGSWEAVRDAPLDDVIGAIRPAGPFEVDANGFRPFEEGIGVKLA